MTPLGRVLVVLAVVGLVAFLSVNVESRQDANGTVVRRTVGLWFSPWYVSEEINDLPRKVSSRRRVEFLSWSWLCLIPVVLCAQRIGRPASSPAEASRDARDQTGPA